MPPRLPAKLRPHGRQNVLFNGYSHLDKQSACFFCSLSLDLNQPRVRPKRRTPQPRRLETTIATTPKDVTIDPRKELESVLLDLERYASNHVNLSRLQLALNGLRQKPGHESIRVAILGLTTGSTPTSTAKEVLKLMLADPLKDVEPWEQEIDAHDSTAPMIIRISATDHDVEAGISLIKEYPLREIHISPATFRGYNLEVLLGNAKVPASEKGGLEEFGDTLLAPTADNGRLTPTTTSVHKSLIVADGIHGAASILSIAPSKHTSAHKYAVNIPEYKPADTTSIPFTPIDAGTASIGLGLVRKNIGNAMEYERLWSRSSIPKLVEWVKADVLTTSDEVTKQPVRDLISSLLEHTSASIQAEEARRLTFTPSPVKKHTFPKTIDNGLSVWAERAHSELQEQLDLAFSGRRWRKLSWWKLFWRVDDVGMLTSDILAQRFLTRAERSSIFLAGQMKEAGISLSPKSDAIVADEPRNNAVASPESDETPEEISWPMNIPDTRSYLQTQTVPALQALAQKLVLQTLSTSGLMTALGGLVYIGTLTTTIYEAGAVAALGIVWSMNRMQKQWETARKFWEGEVREEGRKAVRGVENAMASAIMESNGQEQGRSSSNTQPDSLGKANDLVSRAKELLRQLK